MQVPRQEYLLRKCNVVNMNLPNSNNSVGHCASHNHIQFRQQTLHILRSIFLKTILNNAYRVYCNATKSFTDIQHNARCSLQICPFAKQFVLLLEVCPYKSLEHSDKCYFSNMMKLRIVHDRSLKITIIRNNTE